MDVIETKAEMHDYSVRRRARGERIGLVPTMGALHDGHLSLVRKAREDCDAVVVSIFVNPTQFAPEEDFARYPQPFGADCEACEKLAVDAVFAPTRDEMYPPDAETYVLQERLASALGGASRPTHFQGVLTVLLKFFNVVAPHVAYFGQKDYQQTVVIRRMVADLDVPVEITIMPTVRERDGLAMSSRNKYLSPDEREQALCLVRALERCRHLFADGERSPGKLKEEMSEQIRREASARIDYVEIVKPDSLDRSESVEVGDVALVAVHVGETRLIDNMILAAGPTAG